MNRVTGDYFETLLYKIFVSIDERTSISEVSDDSINTVSSRLQHVDFCKIARRRNTDICERPSTVVWFHNTYLTSPV